MEKILCAKFLQLITTPIKISSCMSCPNAVFFATMRHALVEKIAKFILPKHNIANLIIAIEYCKSIFDSLFQKVIFRKANPCSITFKSTPGIIGYYFPVQKSISFQISNIRFPSLKSKLKQPDIQKIYFSLQPFIQSQGYYNPNRSILVLYIGRCSLVVVYN